MSAVAAYRRKAIVIDDAYARPSPSDLQKNLTTLRRFLRSTPTAKQWFDTNFGLNGSAGASSYFEPLLASAEKTLEMWRRRDECPESNRLLSEGLQDLVGEIQPLQLPLQHVEQALRDRGWDIQSFPKLPDVEAVPAGIDLIVIDYVLAEETPANMAEKIAESTDFLRRLLGRISSTPNSRLPLVILVSSRPAIERRHAENFRKTVGVQGAYFHFIRKSMLQGNFGNRIDGFGSEAEELESYRRAHEALKVALDQAVSSLQHSVANLELQDIAALHVGHLIHEGEALSDYVGWMLGQVLTSKIQKSVELADATDRLPVENHRLLLGHLNPTQGVPRLFCELSSVRTAFGELQKTRRRSRELRFGDIFAAALSRTKIDTNRFLLIVSQTCDLLQGKICNGQVLCVEGRAVEVENSEAGLMRATLRQLDDKGSTLIALGQQYFQIEWQDVDLCTVEQARLRGERGYRYVGRLNEIYALEVQHNALNRLARVGVPVKPGYGVVFGALRLKFWGAKTEIASLSATFENKTVVAVLRPGKKNSVSILLSGELREWLVKKFRDAKAASELIEPLTAPVDELIECLEGWKDFHFVCKKSGKDLLQLFRTRETVDAHTQEVKKETVAMSKVAIALGKVDVFGSVAAPQGVRVQFEFDAIG
ncbi:Uncharacterised protein [Burkholderia pseudomallei]|uniref:hypothetical protein n=1 Tax=Burkholderia pseudomallei TaxID=28450 RepID=UPI0011788726|nr:hypothetical protein [Burkholderia pseudomallei]CAK0539084.1 Uncharacterised protein [Burkholderia pseudomallei]